MFILLRVELRWSVICLLILSFEFFKTDTNWVTVHGEGMWDVSWMTGYLMLLVWSCSGESVGNTQDATSLHNPLSPTFFSFKSRRLKLNWKQDLCVFIFSAFRCGKKGESCLPLYNPPGWKHGLGCSPSCRGKLSKLWSLWCINNNNIGFVVSCHWYSTSYIVLSFSNN